MNFKVMGKLLGKIMILEGILMIFPLIVSIIYQEGFIYIISYAIPIFVLIVVGTILQHLKPERNSLYQKEGFALVALVWILMTLFGAIPFVINKDIPNYIDACFEIMSGFTTTGASIVKDITALKHSTLFWRSFTHWIGGMGILVFILIFIPESGDGSSFHLLRAESPGPQVGKIVSKMKVTTRILYLIYLGLTIIEVVLLLFSKPVVIPGVASESDHLFYCLLTAFGSAGTGGFGFLPNSFEYFSPYAQYVVATFLIIFGINFTLYYLILIGKTKEVLKSEELKAYLAFIVVGITIIVISMVNKYQSVEECFRHAYFQVASIITTTGYTTTNFDKWSEVAKVVIVLLMFSGAMAGSTGGGVKVSRIVIAIKGFGLNIRKLINPNYVAKTKFEGKTLDNKTIQDVFGFLAMYMVILLAGIFILSFDQANGKTYAIGNISQEDIIEIREYEIANNYDLNTDMSNNNEIVTHGFFTNFSAMLSCLSNIGPGLEAVGPYASFAEYNPVSKITLTFAMLIGRLEILPVLILFNKRTWK